MIDPDFDWAIAIRGMTEAQVVAKLNEYDERYREHCELGADRMEARAEAAESQYWHVASALNNEIQKRQAAEKALAELRASTEFEQWEIQHKQIDDLRAKLAAVQEALTGADADWPEDATEAEMVERVLAERNELRALLDAERKTVGDVVRQASELGAKLSAAEEQNVVRAVEYHNAVAQFRQQAEATDAALARVRELAQELATIEAFADEKSRDSSSHTFETIWWIKCRAGRSAEAQKSGQELAQRIYFRQQARVAALEGALDKAQGMAETIASGVYKTLEAHRQAARTLAAAIRNRLEEK